MSGRRFPTDEERRNVVIVGTGDNADVAYEYLRWDSPHHILAFSAERDHIESGTKRALPVVPFEELVLRYPPNDYSLFIAVGYADVNRLRARLFGEAVAKGYSMVSYVSSEAFVWHDAAIGENCFILEDNTIQPFVTIGDDTILWSGNHIGHGVTVGNHVFMASHIVASGFSSIGDFSFVGVNASIGHKVKVGRNCVVGAGVTINRSTKDGQVFVAEAVKPFRLDSDAFSRLMEI